MTRGIIVNWDFPLIINCAIPESFDSLTSSIFAMLFCVFF